MSSKPPAGWTGPIPGDVRIAVVAARFNGPIVNPMLKACRQRLARLKVASDRVEIFRVPGAFELPLAAQSAARTRRFAAVICLGAVIRGQTPHFEYVAGSCARGIAQVALVESLPVIFGVLTTDNEAQARERMRDSAVRAADAAGEMIAMLAELQD